MRSIIVSLLLITSAISFSSCVRKINFKESAHIDTLEIRRRYPMEQPDELVEEYEKQFQVFVGNYNADKKNNFKLHLTDTLVKNTLTIHFDKSKLVTPQKRLTSYFLSTVGLTLPLVLTASGTPFVIGFIVIPQNTSRLGLEMSTDAAFSKYNLSRSHIVTSGFTGSHQKQVQRQGKKLHVMMKRTMNELEEAYFNQSKDSSAKLIARKLYYHSISVGLNLGITVNTINRSAGFAPPGYRALDYTGATYGIKVVYQFTPYVGIETGIHETIRGAAADYTHDSLSYFDTYTQTKTKRFLKRNLVLNYAEFPVTVKLNTSRRRFSPYFRAGFTASWLHQAKIEKNRFEGREEQWTTEKVKDINTFALGLGIGAGFDLKLYRRSKFSFEMMQRNDVTSTIGGSTINTFYINFGLSKQF